MDRAVAEIAFTPNVRKMQSKMGSAEPYSRFLEDDADRINQLGQAETEFLTRRDGFYQASVSETGWPYVQFRGGPPGFLKVLNDRTVAYADLRGNRQYVSAGNLAGDNRVSLIFMDYPNRRRLKIWGSAQLVDASDDPQLLKRLSIADYRGHPERAVVISVEALDWNCPQHIPQRLTPEEFEPILAPMRAEISRLKEENDALRDWLGSGAKPGKTTG